MFLGGGQIIFFSAGQIMFFIFLMPSFFIREFNVDTFMPSRSAAPPAPETFPLHFLIVSMIWAFSNSSMEAPVESVGSLGTTVDPRGISASFSPFVKRTVRWIRCSSSRILPGQLYF